MFTYGSLVTFHLGLGIGVIGPAFYISLVIWDGTLFTSPLWASIESRNGFDCVHLFDRLDIYIRHSTDNSNRSNWMSDSGLYDMTDQ